MFLVLKKLMIIILYIINIKNEVDYVFFFQSLGCLLYAMCFYKSPFDAVYERGDSVALAVVSGLISIPDNNPFSEVRFT